MNKKGFTLVELLATLVILGIVTGLVFITVGGNLGKTKEKSEEIFVGTIRDAMNIYLDSTDKNYKGDVRLQFDYVCSFTKSLKNGVKLYKSTQKISLYDVANSSYKPIDTSELVNPNNESKCNYTDDIIDIYRDDDFVYYYRIPRTSLDCLTLDLDNDITNLPNLPDSCNIN